MPIFEYTAMNNQGKTVKGSLNADTAKLMRQKLRSQGLIPIEVNESVRSKNQVIHKANSLDFKVPLVQLMLFTIEMASLLKAGIEVEECLLSVSQAIENRKLKNIVLGVHSKILEGHSFAASLGDYPKAFPVIYRSTVKAGEEAGHLDDVLEHLAHYLEKQHYIKQKIKQALIYPTLLTVISMGIVVFLLTYVTPKIIGLFQDSEQQLPVATTILIAISEYCQNYGWMTLVGLFCLYLIWKLLRKSETINYHYQKFLLGLPFLGQMIMMIQTSRFMRALSILTRSKVPVLEALKASTNLVDNLPIQSALQKARVHIKEGTNMHLAFKHTRYFSSICLQFIASGEKTGRLEDMLMHASKHQERKVESTLESLLIIFEPLLILLMGGVVLFIVLAILLPMFQLSNLVA